MMAATTGCPRARRDLALQEAGREGLLYDREGELIHILNSTAVEIWKVCDGANDIPAIESMLRSKFGVGDDHDVASDIENLLKNLDERGLLEGVGADPAGEPRKGTMAGSQRRA